MNGTSTSTGTGETSPRLLERMARWATRATGSDAAFAVALGGVVLWLLSGVYFNFSEEWFYRLSSITGIIAFLLLFLLQRSQNIDARATQLKLNEIVAALEGASNRLIAVEHRPEEELLVLTGQYQEISGTAAQGPDVTRSLSVEQAVQKAAEDSRS